MRLGVVIGNDPWTFFEDVYQELASHHETDIFKQRRIQTPVFHQRVNRSLFRHDLSAFLRTHDVVFFEWASDLLIAASRLPKQCRVVTRLHRYELFQWAPKINWGVVDRIILVSQAMKRNFVAQFPDQEQKTIVLPVGVSMEKFQWREKSFNGDIGLLCHLTPRKRVYDLILAFFTILSERNDLHLHIGGAVPDGNEDYYDALQKLVERLNLCDKVIFYGKITDSASWYRNIDIFVSNSFAEGLQVAPMEAMASGCYTISHHWDGAEELVPQANLFLTNDELRECILRYCDATEAERRQQREAMRAIVLERFDLDRVRRQIRGIVEELGPLA